MLNTVLYTLKNRLILKYLNLLSTNGPVKVTVRHNIAYGDKWKGLS